MKKTLNISREILAVLLTSVILLFSFLAFRTNIFNQTNGRTFLVQPISAIIVPHHDLASSLRARTLLDASAKVNPKTVVIVSPNHFDAGGYNIETTDRTWRLTNAYFMPDTTKIQALNLPLVDMAFDREHGIFNLLDPVKTVFPDTKIIPIMIKQNTPAAQIDDLEKSLELVCGGGCLLISSIDFSHYQPASIASVHDLLSIKTLSNLNENLAWQTEVDSNPTLYLTIKWAKAKNTNDFHLSANTNSGIISHSPDAESTSYVSGWFESGLVNPTKTETFVAGFNLNNLSDKRLANGLDQKIDLNNNHEMGLICYNKPEYCGLNRLFWGPNFYHPILNGLVVEGEIQTDQYKLVLAPTDPQTNLILTGQKKLDEINQIRHNLGLNPTTIVDEYDTIYLNK